MCERSLQLDCRIVYPTVCWSVTYLIFGTYHSWLSAFQHEQLAVVEVIKLIMIICPISATGFLNHNCCVITVGVIKKFTFFLVRTNLRSCHFLKRIVFTAVNIVYSYICQHCFTAVISHTVHGLNGWHPYVAP